MAGSLQHAAVHGVVVLAGGNYETRPGDLAIFVDLVVMVEHTAGRFGLPGSLEAIDAGGSAHMLIENARVGEDLFDFFNAIENFDQPCVVIVERTRDRSG